MEKNPLHFVFQMVSPRPQSQESQGLRLELGCPPCWSQAGDKKGVPSALSELSSCCKGSQWAMSGLGCSPSLETMKGKTEMSIWEIGSQRPAGSLRGSHGLSIVFTLIHFLAVVFCMTSGEAGTRDLSSPLTWEQEELLSRPWPPQAGHRTPKGHRDDIKLLWDVLRTSLV